MVSVTMKELLEAGVHFGHQVRRWNPKMKEYIFGERNGINIIDLQKTQRMFRDAIQYVTNLASEDRGRTILFVGTKRQAQDAIREEADRAGQFYINQRWLGGLLTNFQTVQKSIKRLRELEAMQTDGRYELLTKKERLKLDRERETGEEFLRHQEYDAPRRDSLLTSARGDRGRGGERLGIPVIAVVDTNCSPEGVDYIIPATTTPARGGLFAARSPMPWSKVTDALEERTRRKKCRAGVQPGQVAAMPRLWATRRRPVETSSARRAATRSGRRTSPHERFRAVRRNAGLGGGQPGFGKTATAGHHGDHPQEGTSAPVRGASGGGQRDGESPGNPPRTGEGRGVGRRGKLTRGTHRQFFIFGERSLQ